jgi:hypothetical protein
MATRYFLKEILRHDTGRRLSKAMHPAQSDTALGQGSMPPKAICPSAVD